MLGPQLQYRNVAATPVLLGRALNRGAGGGNVTMPRLVSELVRLSNSFDSVTTLVDFYGFKGKERRSVDDLEQEIRADVEKTAGSLGDRLVPYVQRHEFESLLFSEVAAFSVIPDVPPHAVRTLLNISSDFATPEDINDHYHTAPSRRIKDAIPRYRKRVDGPLIAAQTGLETIRAQCPRFNAWLEHLETLVDRIQA